MIRLCGWALGFQVGEDRVANILGKRQSCLAPAFSADPQSPSLPVEIAEAEVDDLMRAQPQAGEQ